MAPPWWEKVKNRIKKRRQTSILEPTSNPTSIPSRTTPSPTSSQPIAEPAPGTSSQLPASKLSLGADKDSQLPNPQERLWHEAYDDLEKNEPKVTQAFEKIIAAKLGQNEPSTQLDQAAEHVITASWKPTTVQMHKLVLDGLDRTEKTASVKQGLGNVLQAVQTARVLMNSAVQFVPQAAVAWAGVCLGLEVLSNPIAEDRENREGIIYVLSRMEWYWNLASLLLDENSNEQSFAGLRSQLEKNIRQVYEKLLSYQLKSICLYDRHWLATISRDALKVDGWADQLSKIKEVEAAVQRDMEQYNTEKATIWLGRLADTASAMEKSLQDIHLTIQNQALQQERRFQDDKDNQCLHDLFVTDPRKDKKRIEETKGGLLEGSYSWILEHDHFIRFRNDRQSRLLWIKGDPGKGKTMLLCGIIDKIEQNPSDLLSYFFCQATSNELDNAISVMRGLIYNLIDQDPSLIKHVRKKYDDKREKLFTGANVWYEIRDIATAIFEDPSLKDATIIIDALDECNTDRELLLDLIVNSSTVKWIISSRNWSDIEAKLNNAKQMDKLHLEINQDAVARAVNFYIEYKVDQLEKSKKYDEKTKDAVRHYLTSNADGTFLWVALVCHQLADQKVQKRHTIGTLRSFPPGLNALYKRMIEQISESKDAEVCREILALVSTVYQPVSVDELKGLVLSLKDLGQDEVQEIIASCGSFLTLREGSIFFVHQSAKDFLLENASDEILCSGIQHQHGEIFARSLDLLYNTLRRDIYDLRNPGFPVEKVKTPASDPLASIRYSCIFWVDHLQDSGVVTKAGMSKESEFTSSILKFLRNNYLQWLEALSLMRNIPEGVKAIEKLEKTLIETNSQELQSLVKDARRFILSQKGGIEVAPLQVYTSALIFSPTKSLIRRLFNREYPSWIKLAPKVEADWNACLQTLEGHTGSVWSVAFSADGRVASGSSDSTVKLWDAGSGSCLQTLEGHTGPVWSVAFSADGRVASGSYDDTVKLWDAGSGSCLQTLEGHTGSVYSVAFSADGRVASGSYDDAVKLWDAGSGSCLQTLEGHTGSVWSVAFSADGRVASGSSDRTVKLWDASSGVCLQTLDVNRIINYISFDPDNSSHLLTDADDIFLTSSLTDLMPSTRIALSNAYNQHRYSISANRVWIVQNGNNLIWLPPECRPVASRVAGSTIVIGSRSGRVLVIRLATAVGASPYDEFLSSSEAVHPAIF
ncbi:hypothetical protein BKA67DRAFT_517795 [Truncatella angustata]|uniref:NACHT domain-containing protein n=1 Tax=Truncatella angustata TaxID=152316 RepID=A0A9P8ZZ17_9PEZI|nr:uncharacterized protein BKA67DRAFT_517795 [Truncatella angustata]KAH6654591.1 hypothetical protein BKA67DRAFT_517795 [Truncatella angustata]